MSNIAPMIIKTIITNITTATPVFVIAMDDKILNITESNIVIKNAFKGQCLGPFLVFFFCLCSLSFCLLGVMVLRLLPSSSTYKKPFYLLSITIWTAKYMTT
jgi:hypothetical protein